MNNTKIHIWTYILSISLFILVIQSCSSDNSANQQIVEHETPDNYNGYHDLFELLPSSETGVNFSNDIKDSMQLLCFSFEYAFNGGGVAVGDINNDGLQDLFFTGTLVDNRLYLNMGNFKFKDITESAGVNNGLAMNIGTSMIDINNDGFLDIYVCKSGAVQSPDSRRNTLYINQGDLTFKEESAKYGLDDPSFATQTYFSDFDLDGDLDAYCVNHPINWGKESKLNLKMDTRGNITIVQDTHRLHITDRFLLNENGKFVDKTFEYGVDNAAFGLSAIVNDFNDDGYPDLYICNDYAKPDRLMINQEGKGFKDEILTYFDNITASAMGSDLMDINDDGQMDIFVNDMMPKEIDLIKQQQSYINYDLAIIGRKYGYHDQFKYNSMQVKMADGLYSNFSFMTDTDKSGWSWAVLSEDYDHNGHSDLFIVNGYLKDVTNMDYSKFKLDSLRKTKKTTVTDLYNSWVTIIDSLYIPNYFYSNEGNMNLVDVSKAWNSGPPSFSNGAAFADLDNDGDLDLIVNNINDPAFIMKNTLDEKSNSKSLRIKLKSEDVNYGSTLQAEYEDGSIKTKYYHPIRGFVSSVEQIIHFAIPEGKSIQSLTIKWPDQTTEQFAISGQTGLKEITKGTGNKGQIQIKKDKEIFSKTKLNVSHVENEYIDFKREPLLHFMNSTEGPCIGIGDFDNNGYDDVVVGGAYNQESAYLTNNGKSIARVNAEYFKNTVLSEDVDIEVADIDADGDLDFVTLQGGYQWKQEAEQYGVTAYINDGKANFTQLKLTVPQNNMSSIALLDINGDKQLDIFVGGGAIPGAYPFANASYLLIRGENGYSISNDLPMEGEFGIVKSSESVDINGDGLEDLVIGGEWEPIRILINNNGKLEDKTEEYNMSGTNGFWQSISFDDVDGDGDMDILAGNLGLNTFFKTSKEHPTCIYAYDFDNNGENDPILCTYFGSKSFPVHSRDEILEQMTSLRKKYLRYKPFAQDDIEAMFGKEKVSKATVFLAYTFESTLFINEGGRFIAQALPLEAQASMVRSIVSMDIDGDNITELMVGGNFWDTDLDFGKYDASVGTILKKTNDGLTVIDNQGFIANKNVRSLNVIDGDKILVGNNNSLLELFSLKK